MKFEYFKETDTFYILVKEGDKSKRMNVSKDVCLDYDSTDTLIGIEISNANQNSDVQSLLIKSMPFKNYLVV